MTITKGAWTLSDSQPGEPCTAFQFSSGHLVHTSSPASERWKEWVKQLSATRYVMDVWSLEEFWTLLYVLVFFMLLTIDICFTQHCFHSMRWEFLPQIRVECQAYHRHSQEADGGHIWSGRPERGCRDCKRLFNWNSNVWIFRQHAIFTSLTAHPSLGTATGWWFENYAHVRLSDPTRPPIQTHIRGAPNPPSIPAPKDVLPGTDALCKFKPP